MSWGFIGAAAVGVIGGVVSSQSQKSSAKKAAAAQVEGTDASIAEQRRQFDAIRELFAPYVEAGNTALTGQMNLIGLGGQEAQQTAISAIEQGPEFQEMVRQGEEGILQNASATGGLRGGNTQAALAQFRPSMLNNLINQQYSRLGGISQMGQASAAGQATQGGAVSTNISNLLASQGDALAASRLAQGQANANMYGQIAQGVGSGFGAWMNRNNESGF